MSAVSSSVSQLASKFRGCLVGSLLGDCFGAPFEGDFPVAKTILSSYITKLMAESYKGLLPFYPYTDDTAMTRSVATSLLENKGFEPKNMAEKFTNEYFNHPKRGYGLNVRDVFHALRKQNFEDPFEPAKDQFDGTGSYGNGGAMRVAPVAMFCFNNSEENLIEVAKGQAQITHAHRNGYNGAVLQCLAVHQALKSDPNAPLDKLAYLDSLIAKMETIEDKDSKPGADPKEAKPYSVVLSSLKEVFSDNNKDLSPEQIAVLFGNDVAAFKSVPTAIYTFLRSQEPLLFFESDSPFIRSIVFSIAVGGDTDTIASMAGSISGAFHGIEAIPEPLQRHCEELDVAVQLADQLYELIGSH